MVSWTFHKSLEFHFLFTQVMCSARGWSSYCPCIYVTVSLKCKQSVCNVSIVDPIQHGHEANMIVSHCESKTTLNVYLQSRTYFDDVVRRFFIWSISIDTKHLNTASVHIFLMQINRFNIDILRQGSTPTIKKIQFYFFCSNSIHNMLTLIYSVILHRKTTINITFQLFPNSSIIVFISVFTYGNIEIKL